ncbi:hypothetical protein PIB30_058476 [Stylosanthes scabra]|uniref:Uncharacterized protein n=1 Tax=Stylosanthes scabra TaxID=79078 RepID=A0ABU6YL68_9FABA|nr:hypothetical protein [Stylosanthes scabra]
MIPGITTLPNLLRASLSFLFTWINMYQREAKIQAWVNLQSAKAEAQFKNLEEAHKLLQSADKAFKELAVEFADKAFKDLEFFYCLVI